MGTLRMVLAMATRCLSPPESLSPLSPTLVSYWRGMCMIASWICAFLQPLRTATGAHDQGSVLDTQTPSPLMTHSARRQSRGTAHVDPQAEAGLAVLAPLCGGWAGSAGSPMACHFRGVGLYLAAVSTMSLSALRLPYAML